MKASRVGPHRRAVHLIGLGCLGACAPEAGSALRAPICVPDPQPAILVYVQDWVTKEYVASGATLLLQDGPFRDSVSVPPSRPDLNAHSLATPNSVGRPGTYVVRVRRPPYVETVLTSVTAVSDGCNVAPVVLTVPMRLPLGG